MQQKLQRRRIVALFMAFTMVFSLFSGVGPLNVVATAPSVDYVLRVAGEDGANGVMELSFDFLGTSEYSLSFDIITSDNQVVVQPFGGGLGNLTEGSYFSISPAALLSPGALYSVTIPIAGVTTAGLLISTRSTDAVLRSDEPESVFYITNIRIEGGEEPFFVDFYRGDIPSSVQRGDGTEQLRAVPVSEISFFQQTNTRNVFFGATGGELTATATAGFESFDVTSGDAVEVGETVTFTATPDADILNPVFDWTTSGVALGTLSIAAGGRVATLLVPEELSAYEGDIGVFVVITSEPIPQRAVYFSATNGEIAATVGEVAITSGDLVFVGDVVTFRTTPPALGLGYEPTWTGAIFTGQESDFVRTMPVVVGDGSVTVNVSFARPYVHTYREITFGAVNGTIRMNSGEAVVSGYAEARVGTTLRFIGHPDRVGYLPSWSVTGAAFTVENGNGVTAELVVGDYDVKVLVSFLPDYTLPLVVHVTPPAIVFTTVGSLVELQALVLPTTVAALVYDNGIYVETSLPLFPWNVPSVLAAHDSANILGWTVNTTGNREAYGLETRGEFPVYTYAPPSDVDPDVIFCLTLVDANYDMSQTHNDVTVPLSIWGQPVIALTTDSHLAITGRRPGNSSDGAMFNFAAAGMDISANTYNIVINARVAAGNFRVEGINAAGGSVNLGGVIHTVPPVNGSFPVEFTIGVAGELTHDIVGIRLVTNADGAGYDITIETLRVTILPAPSTLADLVTVPAWWTPVWLDQPITIGESVHRAPGVTEGQLLHARNWGDFDDVAPTWVVNDGNLELRVHGINDNSGLWIHTDELPHNASIVVYGRAYRGDEVRLNVSGAQTGEVDSRATGLVSGGTFSLYATAEQVRLNKGRAGASEMRIQPRPFATIGSEAIVYITNITIEAEEPQYTLEELAEMLQVAFENYVPTNATRRLEIENIVRPIVGLNADVDFTWTVPFNRVNAIDDYGLITGTIRLYRGDEYVDVVLNMVIIPRPSGYLFNLQEYIAPMDLGQIPAAGTTHLTGTHGVAEVTNHVREDEENNRYVFIDRTAANSTRGLLLRDLEMFEGDILRVYGTLLTPGLTMRFQAESLTGHMPGNFAPNPDNGAFIMNYTITTTFANLASHNMRIIPHASGAAGNIPAQVRIDQITLYRPALVVCGECDGMSCCSECGAQCDEGCGYEFCTWCDICEDHECLCAVRIVNPELAGQDLIVVSPYQGVDWATWYQFNAALHTHTIRSDGSAPVRDAVVEHFNRGFDILAITDHNVIDTGNWTQHPPGPMPRTWMWWPAGGGNPLQQLPTPGIGWWNHPGNLMTPEEQSAIIDGTWTPSELWALPIGTRFTQFRRPQMRAYLGMPAGQDGVGLIGIPFSIEQTYMHHINTFWANFSSHYTQGRAAIPANANRVAPTLDANGRPPVWFGQDEMAILRRTQYLDGLAMILHPGRHTCYLDERCSVSVGGTMCYHAGGQGHAAASNNPASVARYVEWFETFSAAAGFELFNRPDHESRSDRILWDNVLTNLMPRGRAVWGFAADDSHSNNGIGLGWSIMLMPELADDEVRNAMETGASYFVSRVDRQLGVNADVTTSAGDAWRAPLETAPIPTITNIEVATTGANDIAESITISGANFDEIMWVTGNVHNTTTGGGVILQREVFEGGDRANRTSTLDLTDAGQYVWGNYVRAVLICRTGITGTTIDSHGVALTQPFGIYVVNQVPEHDFDYYYDQLYALGSNNWTGEVWNNLGEERCAQFNLRGSNGIVIEGGTAIENWGLPSTVWIRTMRGWGYHASVTWDKSGLDLDFDPEFDGEQVFVLTGTFELPNNYFRGIRDQVFNPLGIPQTVELTVIVEGYVPAAVVVETMWQMSRDAFVQGMTLGDFIARTDATPDEMSDWLGPNLDQSGADDYDYLTFTVIETPIVNEDGDNTLGFAVTDRFNYYVGIDVVLAPLGLSDDGEYRITFVGSRGVAPIVIRRNVAPWSVNLTPVEIEGTPPGDWSIALDFTRDSIRGYSDPQTLRVQFGAWAPGDGALQASYNLYDVIVERLERPVLVRRPRGLSVVGDDTLRVVEEETAVLEVEVRPEAAETEGYVVVWSSDDETIATIATTPGALNLTSVLTGVAAGQVTVTAQLTSPGAFEGYRNIGAPVTFDVTVITELEGVREELRELILTLVALFTISSAVYAHEVPYGDYFVSNPHRELLTEAVYGMVEIDDYYQVTSWTFDGLDAITSIPDLQAALEALTIAIVEFNALRQLGTQVTLATLEEPATIGPLTVAVMSAGDVIAMLEEARPTAVVTTTPVTTPPIVSVPLEWELVGTFSAAEGAPNTFRWTAQLPNNVLPGDVDITGTVVVVNYDPDAVHFVVTFVAPITAMVGDEPITSPANVVSGSAVVFTANAPSGQRVRQWYVDGVAQAGEAGATFAIEAVTSAVTVTVTFEPDVGTDDWAYVIAMPYFGIRGALNSGWHDDYEELRHIPFETPANLQVGDSPEGILVANRNPSATGANNDGFAIDVLGLRASTHELFVDAGTERDIVIAGRMPAGREIHLQGFGPDDGSDENADVIIFDDGTFVVTIRYEYGFTSPIAGGWPNETDWLWDTGWGTGLNAMTARSLVAAVINGTRPAPVLASPEGEIGNFAYTITGIRVGDTTLIGVIPQEPGEDEAPVTFTANPTTGGTVTATVGGTAITSGANVTVGENVTFIAVANDGFEFTNWTIGGEVVGTATTLVREVLEAGLTVVANFTPEEVNVEVPVNFHASPSTGGNVTASVGSDAINSGDTVVVGTSVQFTASANADYDFISWTVGGVVQGTDTTITFAVPAGGVTMVANFVHVDTPPAQVNFQAIPAASGTVTAEVGGDEINSGDYVDVGDNVVFIANANDGYVFVNWLVNGIDHGTAATLELPVPVVGLNVVANFAPEGVLPQQVFFSASPTDRGTVTAVVVDGNVITSGDTVAVGSQVQFTAVANPGYVFVGWTVGGAEPSLTLTVILGGLNVVANFEVAGQEAPVTFVASPVAGGTVTATVDGSPITSGTSLAVGTFVTFTASVNADFGFAGWTVNGDAVEGATLTLTRAVVEGGLDVVANFVDLTLPPQPVTFVANPETGGTVTAVSGGSVIDSGDTVSAGAIVIFTADVNAGYVFTGWTVNGDAVAGTALTLTRAVVEGGLDVIANFEESLPAQPVTFVANPATGGTVVAAVGGTPIGSGDTVDVGLNVQFTATANVGYAFTGWTVNDESVAGATLTRAVIEGGLDVVANFEEDGNGYDFEFFGRDATAIMGDDSDVIGAAELLALRQWNATGGFAPTALHNAMRAAMPQGFHDAIADFGRELYVQPTSGNFEFHGRDATAIMGDDSDVIGAAELLALRQWNATGGFAPTALHNAMRAAMPQGFHDAIADFGRRLYIQE